MYFTNLNWGSRTICPSPTVQYCAPTPPGRFNFLRNTICQLPTSGSLQSATQWWQEWPGLLHTWVQDHNVLEVIGKSSKLITPVAKSAWQDMLYHSLTYLTWWRGFQQCKVHKGLPSCKLLLKTMNHLLSIWLIEVLASQKARGLHHRSSCHPSPWRLSTLPLIANRHFPSPSNPSTPSFTSFLLNSHLGQIILHSSSANCNVDCRLASKLVLNGKFKTCSI